MEDNKFILNNMTYSFSCLNSYNTCPYGFKLTYVDGEKRVNNAFGEYGLLVHKCFEKYLKGELTLWDLANYYEENFGEFVQSGFPPYPRGMRDKYYQSGLDFFENIDFNIYDYEILIIEDLIPYQYKDINLVIKPDAVIKDKETGKTILLDFKTSKLHGGSKDKKKIDGYLNQMFLYSYVIWLEKNIAIDEVWIWFVRNNEIRTFEMGSDETLIAIKWLEETYEKIISDNTWKANRNKKNKYFCDFICSMRNICNAPLEE